VKQIGRHRWAAGRRGRGALLLEALLALTVFVSAGLAILTMVERAVASLSMVRDLRHAADLARSALAQLEAGIAEAETLSGPVPPWMEDEEGFDDAPPTPTGWELIVATAPSPFDGLTLVTVTAVRSEETGASGDDGAVSYTLRQLVRLAARAEEGAGDEGELLEAARDGEQGLPPPPVEEAGP
jgi:hypothetical protein